MAQRKSLLVGLYADRNSKVRLIDLGPWEEQDGDWYLRLRDLLSAYCRHLETVFPGSRLMYHLTDDPGNTSSLLVTLDTNDYIIWCAIEGRDDMIVSNNHRRAGHDQARST